MEGRPLMKLIRYLGSSFVCASLLLQYAHAATLPCDQQTLSGGNQDYDYVSFNHRASQQNLQQRRAAGITVDAINHAQYLQKTFGIAEKPTPFFTKPHLNQAAGKLLGHPVTIYLKDETIHPTGSFKDRMPIRFYQRVVSDVEKLKQTTNPQTTNLKVVAVSTGNHGRAVADAANRANAYIKHAGLQNNFHITAEITMSADALPHKKAAIANLGASIRDHYQNKAIPGYDAAEDLVLQDTQTDPDHILLLPHADANSINGYAVIANEMIQQAQSQSIDLAKAKPGEVLMLVPLGSGGILSGTEEISARYPNVYSIGVTAAPADITYRSLKQCKMVRTALPYQGKLIVDGVMATPEEYSLDRIREMAAGVALVNQQDAVYATALLRKNGVVIEPTSALPLAALLLGSGKDFTHTRYAFIVLTGKNISPEMEAEIRRLSQMDESRLTSYFAGRRAMIAKKLARSSPPGKIKHLS